MITLVQKKVTEVMVAMQYLIYMKLQHNTGKTIQP